MDRAPADMAGPRQVDIAAQPAARLGDSLVALFEHIRPLPGKVGWVQCHVTADLASAPGTTLDPALARACAAVADATDAASTTFDRPAYHNRQHFCEVALTGYVLCVMARVDTTSTQLVLLAALLHDFVHDSGRHAAFVQERASVRAARPLLEAAGLRAAAIDRLLAMVLATDVAQGTAFAAAACDLHAGVVSAPPVVPAGAPELAALVADAPLARLARLLCEADVLPSIGLGVAHGMRLQAHLAREWGRPLDKRDKIAFIDGVLRDGLVGAFFRPNVEAMRDTLLVAQLDAPAAG